MTTSNFVVSEPHHCSPRVVVRTVRPAARFLAVIRLHHQHAIKTLTPVLGVGARAISRKLDADDVLHLSIHEAAAVIGHVADDVAVDLLQSLAHDAGKGERVQVALAAAALPTGSPEVIERDFALFSSRFLSLADDALHHRLPSIEAKRLHELAIGVEARSIALLRVAEGGYDNA